MSVFKSIFGPSKAEVWSAVAQQIGARYDADQLFSSGGVTLKVGDWEIRLDTYTTSSGNSSQTYTRVRAPFVNPEGQRIRESSTSAAIRPKPGHQGSATMRS